MTDPTTPIWDIIRGVWRFSALNAFVKLGAVEALRDGPLPLAELAQRCEADPDYLSRVLRVIASFGLVERTGDSYTLTESGAVLHPDHPRSLYSGVYFAADPAFAYSLASLPETVRAGRPAFVARYGGLYDYLAASPEVGALFDSYMDGRSQPFAEALAGAYDFSAASTVVDVGGGKGHILAAVLAANPHLRGTVYELAHLAGSARACLAERGVADRCEVVTGDFFESVPAGADIYLLSNIVHNWNDAEARKILTNVREALGDGGKVICLDMVLPDDDSPHMGKELDMRMMGLFGSGRERSRAEYVELLRQSGLAVTDIVELAVATSAVVSVRAS